MTIMVDELRVWPTSIRCFKSGSCHLTTDGPIDELHAFAARIGMRREWYQEHRIAPHYDLTASRRERALALGAVFVPMREQVRQRRATATTEKEDGPMSEYTWQEGDRAIVVNGPQTGGDGRIDFLDWPRGRALVDFGGGLIWVPLVNLRPPSGRSLWNQPNRRDGT